MLVTVGVKENEKLTIFFQMRALTLKSTCSVRFSMYFPPSIIRSKTVLTRHSVVEVVNLVFCPGGYITVWDVGNFLLDPPSEKSNGDQREDEQESNKEESKKEPKVNCLAHHYHLSLLLLFFHLCLYQSSVTVQNMSNANSKF